MYRTTAVLLLGIIAPATASAQPAAPRIEKEDIFERLAPLAPPRATKTAPATADAAPPTPSPGPILRDVTAHNGGALSEEAFAQPIGSAVKETQPPVARNLSPRVRRLLNPSQTAGPSDGRPQVVDEAHIVQTQGELAQLSPRELRQLVGISAELLSKELADVHYSDRWQRFLRLSEVSATFAADAQAAPDSGLLLIRDSYGKIARDKQYHVITDHYAFHLLQHGLAEYLSTEQQRNERRAAYDEAGKLLKSLQPVPTGHQWREYFALDRAARLLTSAQPLSRDEVGQLQLILKRFDQAALEPRFKAVANLPGFAALHRRLQIAVAVIPDAQADAFTQTELPGRPVPGDRPPTIHLTSQAGLAFHRGKNAGAWQVVDGPVALKSGDSVRTADHGIARVAVGAHYQVVCSPGVLLHISQYMDDDGRLVTQLHCEEGGFKISGGAKLFTAEAALASPEHRLVITRGEHQITPREVPLQLIFQHDSRETRTRAAVYEGSVQLRHQRTGDQINLIAGRQAVMLPQGIALRAADEKSETWWRSQPVQTAAEPGEESTR